MSSHQIHSSIKERLGYPEDISDEELLDDWRKRSTQVCKPCWELKYCPYGPLVEQAPLLPQTREKARKHIEYIKSCLESGMIGNRKELDEDTISRWESIVDKARDDISSVSHLFQGEYYFEKILQDEDRDRPIEEIMSPSYNKLGVSNLPFPIDEDLAPEPDIDEEFEEFIRSKIREMESAIEDGFVDRRRSLDDNRREIFERRVENFEEDNYPEEIPDEIKFMECNIFGHICPVTLSGESVTETSERRRRGRYILFKVKMRVVRRDNYTCQKCGKHLREDELEFDHVIPVSKGGSSEEHNVQLTCFDCNRSKSDKVEI